MYERFTDRARQVMQLANQEAQRFNHEYIHVEHILIGMVKEGDGIASAALNEWCRGDKQGFLSRLRLETEKRKPQGPSMVTMGRLPHTPKVKDMIVRAMEIAQEWKHGFVGTEHILMAIVTDKDLETCAILRAIGINPDDVRDEILYLMGKGEVKPTKSEWETKMEAEHGKELPEKTNEFTFTIPTAGASYPETYEVIGDEMTEAEAMAYRDGAFRMYALSHAAAMSRTQSMTPTEVVDAARVFYNFLSEKTEGKEC